MFKILFFVSILTLLAFVGCSRRTENTTVDIIFEEPTEIVQPTEPEKIYEPAEITELPIVEETIYEPEPAFNLTTLPFEDAHDKIIYLYGQTPDLIALAGENRFPRWLELTQDGFILMYEAQYIPTIVTVETLGFIQQLFCFQTLAADMAAALLAVGYVELGHLEFYRQYDNTNITMFFEGENFRVRYSVMPHPEYQGGSGVPVPYEALLANSSFFRNIYSWRQWGAPPRTRALPDIPMEANIQPIYTPDLWAPPHIDLEFFYEQGVPLPCGALGLGGWFALNGWQRYAVFEYTSVEQPALRAELFSLTMEAAGFRRVEGLTFTNEVVNISLSFSLANWIFNGEADITITMMCYSMDIEPIGPEPQEDFPISNTRWGGLQFAMEMELPERLQHNTFSMSQQHTMAIREDGTVWVWGGTDWSNIAVIGDGGRYALEPVMVMENAVSVVAGLGYSLVIDENGVLWAWGDNDFGQLGDGTTEARATPVQIMDDVIYVTVYAAHFSSHVGSAPRTYAITSDGVLWGWGSSGWWDFFGALGDGATETRTSPVQIMENVRHIIPTQDGGIAVTHDGTIWQWGDISLYPVQIDSMPVVYDQFIIDENSILWGIGRNRNVDHWRETQPLLGDGTALDRTRPVKIMENIACVTRSANFVYALDNNGTLWGWGFNIGGFLGDGTMEDRFTPVRIMDNVVRIESTYMVDHGWLGFISTFAITADGAVWAWGGRGFNPMQPMLGDGMRENRIAPVLVLDGVR